MNKIKDYLLKWTLGISTLGIYGKLGLMLQATIYSFVNIWDASSFEKFLLITGVFTLEAILVIVLYDYLKKDFFGIESYKAGTTYEDTFILRSFNKIKTIYATYSKNLFILFFVYIILFPPFAFIAGPVITSILFRNTDTSHPGFINRETLRYFIPSNIVSVLGKYFMFVELPVAIVNFINAIKNTYSEILSYLW